MKKFLSFLAVLALLTALWIPALAAEPELDYVTDAALLLNDEEWEALEEKAEEISARYQCGVYIITVDDYTQFNRESAYEAAKTIYTTNSLGLGDDGSGVLLLLSMSNRKYALIAHGYGHTAFTDYGRTQLEDCFLDNFKKDDWYGGFSDYLDKCDSMLSSAREGHPLDVKPSPLAISAGNLISVALSFGAAYIVCIILRSTMKSVAVKEEADSYIRRDSIRFSAREDQFSHTSQIRTKIERNNDSGMGGTTVDSDGFSGSSGSF